MPDYPYKLARLANAGHPICDDPNKRWYIVFWVWDVNLGKMVRKRDFEINRLKAKKERADFSETRIREINKLLASGYVVNGKQVKSSVPIVTYDKNMRLIPGLKYALQVKKGETRNSTYQNIESVLRGFEAFAIAQKWEGLLVRAITKLDIMLYLDHCIARGLQKITRNNNLGRMGTLFATLHSREMIPANPCEGIPQLDEADGRNWAYVPAQVTQLKEAITATRPELWDFIQFMFYGFIRPNEIRQLRVNDVDLANGKIFIASGIAKNKRSMYVRMSDKFAVTVGRVIADKRPYDLIFQNPKKPGTMLPENLMSTWHLEILRQLGYPADYTLYSWKHTGVVEHYRAGVDIKSLQAQLRHASLTETDKYLRSLGLFANREIEDKSPAI